MKIVLVKNLHTSANLAQQNRNQNVKVAKMVKFTKTCDQYPRKCKFGIQLHNPPPFCWVEKRFSENAVQVKWEFPSAWGRVLFNGISKNEQIQFFDLQMYLSLILTS